MFSKHSTSSGSFASHSITINLPCDHLLRVKHCAKKLKRTTSCQSLNNPMRLVISWMRKLKLGKFKFPRITEIFNTKNRDSNTEVDRRQTPVPQPVSSALRFRCTLGKAEILITLWLWGWAHQTIYPKCQLIPSFHHDVTQYVKTQKMECMPSSLPPSPAQGMSWQPFPPKPPAEVWGGLRSVRAVHVWWAEHWEGDEG